MAHHEVDEYGNAPKNAGIGDYITTAGGTYEIVDGASMTPEERSAQGIGYNPTSGLYSKKVSGITTSELSYQNYNTANQWKQQADRHVKQQLKADYETNLSNAMQGYNTNLAGLKNQETETKENYEQNVRDAQEAAYYSGQASMAGAANRGMANSAQSQAAANSLLYGVGNTMAELNSDKNMLLDKIYTNINTLTQNYNIQLDELERNKLAQELSMLSDNQLNYLAQVMNIDEFNADAYNNYRNQQMQMEWQSAENQKNRDHDIYMFGLQNGGYGGNGDNGNTNERDAYNLETALLNMDYPFTPQQLQDLERKLEGIRLGYVTVEDYQRTLNSYINSPSAPSYALNETNVRMPFDSKWSSPLYNIK